MNARLSRKAKGDCSCGGRCGDCQKGKKKLSRMPASTSAPPGVAPPIVHDVLRSPGQPLDFATRASMESRLAHDFSRVRIHSGGAAAESARAVDAMAYTVGEHVVLGESANRDVLAHELVHVMQQEGSRAGGTIEIAPADSSEEREADALRAPRRSSPRAAALHRKPTQPTPSPSCTPRQGFTEYGCYCGAGSSCPSLTCTPADSLDACCQVHDIAYGPCTFVDRFTVGTPCCYVTAVADAVLCNCAKAQAGRFTGDAESYRQAVMAIFCNHPGCAPLPSIPKLPNWRDLIPDLPKIPIPDIPILPKFDWLPSLPVRDLFGALPPEKVKEAIA